MVCYRQVKRALLEVDRAGGGPSRVLGFVTQPYPRCACLPTMTLLQDAAVRQAPPASLEQLQGYHSRWDDGAGGWGCYRAGVCIDCDCDQGPFFCSAACANPVPPPSSQGVPGGTLTRWSKLSYSYVTVQCINQSINQSINQCINQCINHSINREYLAALAHWDKLSERRRAAYGLEDDCAPFPGWVRMG